MQCLFFYGHSNLPGYWKPAGPFRLATELRDAGFSVQCVDIMFNTPELLMKVLDKFVTSETLWLGVSTTFLQNFFNVRVRRLEADAKSHFYDEQLKTIMAFCRQRSPNIKFIVGGANYVNLEEYGWYSFTGYCDTEIVEFTRWCKDSTYNPKIQRLGKLIQGQEFKGFSTSKIRWEKNDIMRPGEFLPIEVARGCIFKCKFCAYPLNGKTKGEWIKQASVLKEELLYNYEEFGINSYYIADDTYNDSTDKIRMLYEDVYSQLPFKLDFTSYLRLDLMVRFPEQAGILRDSGWNSALFGIETNNSVSAKAIGKGMDFNRQIEYLWEIKQGEFKDVLMHSGFIMGLPYDTPESLDDLQQFLLSDRNPLDDWVVRPLGINPVNRNIQRHFFSEFDLEFEKYGYETYEEPGDGRIFWRLPTQGLTWADCDRRSNELLAISKKLPNCKYGANEYCHQAMVVPRCDVKALSRTELLAKYDIPGLRKTRRDEYYQILMSL